MKSIFKTFLTITLLTLAACNTKQKQKATEYQTTKEVAIAKTPLSQAEILLAETIKAHGSELYDTAHYRFTFRDKAYTFKNSANTSRYTITSIKKTDTIQDLLENYSLTRTINRKAVSLSEKDIAKYTEALNSVVYFATLPHKLKDKAVNKTYEGRATIKGQNYDLLGISFDQEGGGKDYDDTFLYWINKQTKTVDYLAYSYSTNDGGVRFRSAFNPRVVEGIRFQDYINYKVPIGTPLQAITTLYEKGSLKELSKIITEDVYKIE